MRESSTSMESSDLDYLNGLFDHLSKVGEAELDEFCRDFCVSDEGKEEFKEYEDWRLVVAIHRLSDEEFLRVTEIAMHNQGKKFIGFHDLSNQIAYLRGFADHERRTRPSGEDIPLSRERYEGLEELIPPHEVTRLY
jgi:hypothetical protein